MNRLGTFALLVISFLYCPLLNAGGPNLQKPQSFTGQEEITGWVMSEKLDGIRAYWNGTRLLTRKGLPLRPPPWFTAGFPSFELDGELWSGRGGIRIYPVCGAG